MSERVEIELRWSRPDANTVVAICYVIPTPEAASDLLDALVSILRESTRGPCPGGNYAQPIRLAIQQLAAAHCSQRIDGQIDYFGDGAQSTGRAGQGKGRLRSRPDPTDHGGTPRNRYARVTERSGSPP